MRFLYLGFGFRSTFHPGTNTDAGSHAPQRKESPRPAQVWPAGRQDLDNHGTQPEKSSSAAAPAQKSGIVFAQAPVWPAYPAGHRWIPSTLCTTGVPRHQSRGAEQPPELETAHGMNNGRYGNGAGQTIAGHIRCERFCQMYLGIHSFSDLRRATAHPGFQSAPASPAPAPDPPCGTGSRIPCGSPAHLLQSENLLPSTDGGTSGR